MKRFNILSIVVILIMILTMVMLVIAKGPVGDTITINWLEDAERYNAEDLLLSSWANDPLGPAELIKTGKAYHFADIAEYYNQPLENLKGSLVISGAGQLSGHATYISPRSGLPIRDRFKGEVTIDTEAETMVGTYAQWSYAFGTEGDVLSSYPGAIKDEDGEEEPCWWLVGYTEYVAHE